jgi:hypothetical protein
MPPTSLATGARVTGRRRSGPLPIAGSHTSIVTIRGEAVDDIDLSRMQAVAEVAGVADAWWRGEDAVIAVYRGE